MNMDAHIIDKNVDIDGRRFVIRKYDAFTGIKIGKMFIAKVLPMFQSFIPMLTEFLKGKKGKDADKSEIGAKILGDLGNILKLDKIAQALDLITGDDLDYIMRYSLMCCYEPLGSGPVQVMRPDGTYGVEEVEYDPLLVLRLVCESVQWGLGDFFTGDRLASIMKPLSTSL